MNTKTLMLSLILAAGLLGFSAPGQAYTEYDITVCAIQAQNDANTAFIRPCAPWTSQNACPNPTWVGWDMNQFQGKTMYATALTAQLTGKAVRIRLDGVTCVGGHDATTMIRMNN